MYGFPSFAQDDGNQSKSSDRVSPRFTANGVRRESRKSNPRHVTTEQIQQHPLLGRRSPQRLPDSVSGWSAKASRLLRLTGLRFRADCAEPRDIREDLGTCAKWLLEAKAPFLTLCQRFSLGDISKERRRG